MNQHVQEKLLAEAMRIGDQLVEGAVPDGNGIAWLTADLLHFTDRVVQKYLYTGTCGIAAFLAELYRHTRDEKYLRAAIRSMDALDEAIAVEPPISYALYSGQMSISLTQLRLYQVTGQQRFLDRALALTREADNFLKFQHLDLLNGLAGTLLGLLHVYAATRDEQLLRSVDRFTGRLVEAAYPGKQGLYWERSGTNIHPLCGFSHGASGIGFVFLELGRFFGNDTFFRVAEGAFRYEAQHYDADGRNWTDWRKGIFGETDEKEYREAYDAGDADFFTRGRNTNAWCNGAAGIGLARLRAYELLGSPGHLREATLALDKTAATLSRHSGLFTLCHGKCGDAELFLEAYRVLGDPQYLSVAADVALEAIAHREKTGMYPPGLDTPHEDGSLFLGTAGIGYFYLRLLDLAATPSLLAPRLEATPVPRPGPAFPNLALATAAAEQTFLQKAFPRTLHLLGGLAPGPLAGYLAAPPGAGRPGLKEAWAAFAEEQAGRLPEPVKARLDDALRFEKHQSDLDDAVRSDTLLLFKEVRKADEYARHRRSGTAFSEVSLVVDHDVRVVETGWDWSGDDPAGWSENLDAPAEQRFVLLSPTAEGVRAVPITLFTHVLLDLFATPQTVGAAVTAMLEELQPEADGSPAEAARLIEAQIDQLWRRGFLLEPAKHPLTLNRHPALQPNVFAGAAFANPA